MTPPAAVRVTLLLAAMVSGLHRGARLAWVMAAGSVGLAAMFNLPVPAFLGSVRSVLADPNSLSLLLVVATVLVLATTLETSGRMARGLRYLGAALGSRRLALASTPMVIGLLPMPGGAAFSAPPVEVASAGLGLSAERKSLINYMFRHVWQYSWPLCPGLLIAASLAGLPVVRIALAQLPLTIAAIGGAWVVLLSGIGGETVARESRAFHRFVSELAPVAAGVGGGFALESIGSPPLPEKAGLGLGLAAAVAWLWVRDGRALRAVKVIVGRSRLPSMLAMVASVLLFQRVLQDSGCLRQLAQELTSVGIPLILLAPVLSLTTGMVAGIEIAFAGTVLPLVLGIAAQTGTVDAVGLIALVFAAGMVGVMLSPLHLCMILTREYFGAQLGGLYRRLVLALLPILATGFLLYTIRS